MADQGNSGPAPAPGSRRRFRGNGGGRRSGVGKGTRTSGVNGPIGRSPAPHAPAQAPMSVPDEGQARFPRRPTFAALDLGTNNCRLLIARPDGPDFIIVDAFSRIVRLGEGLAASGRISDAAMDRAVDALAICADKLRRRRVLLSRAVATEACRRAVNGREFIDRVRDETGIVLDIISAEEEARLAVLGCHQLLSPGEGPALIFDIGGGSTELVLLDDSGGDPVILDWQSVPWGVVTLTEAERHDSDDPCARVAAYEAMRRHVRTSFLAFADRISRRWPGPSGSGLRLLGTSGTVTTLASLFLDLPSYDRSKVDGLNVATSDMRAVCEQLASMSLSQREQLACVGRERADLVVAGCAVLEEICDIWPAPALDVADRGIREGVLRQMMRAHAQGGHTGSGAGA
ncbi:Ppx/GppA family phosphatase [Sphingomonas lacunae]|uniref:Ppx/GppA family phosphatase n=2 Tax=Sphingomonas lacunae TaxID=2698828 RepID=A0A6M4AYU8_9SPHN|nr:Ppx/GppA family phosphatase [Sphingomonas lacunae]